MSKTEKKIVRGLLVKIENGFNARIERTIKMLRKLGIDNKSRKEWVNESALKKLQFERENPDYFLETEYVNFYLDSTTFEQIEERVKEISKKTGVPFTKKKWLIDAINRKIQEDESLIREKLQELQDSFDLN